MLIEVADHLARSIVLHAFHPYRYRILYPAQLLVRTRAQIHNKIVYPLERLRNLLAPARLHGAAAKLRAPRKPVMRNRVAGAEDAKEGVANSKAIPRGQGRGIQGIKKHAGITQHGRHGGGGKKPLIGFGLTTQLFRKLEYLHGLVFRKRLQLSGNFAPGIVQLRKGQLAEVKGLSRTAMSLSF